MRLRRLAACGSQRAKITEKVHKPTQNHYIEWPVLSDIILNCESQGEKGRTCKKYKILIGSCVFFFHFIHDFLFSPGHLLKKKKINVLSFFLLEIVSFFTKYCIQNCIILIMLLHPFTNIFTCL